MRRWVPGSARGGSASVRLTLDQVSGRDLVFCNEFAARGGSANSDAGFKAETELTRMQAAGLLILERDPEPPFSVVRVALSPDMRDLLCNPEPARSDHSAAGKIGSEPAPAKPNSFRKGFEVARALMSAALKAEFSGCEGLSTGEQAAAFERNLMRRISTLQPPSGLS